MNWTCVETDGVFSREDRNSVGDSDVGQGAEVSFVVTMFEEEGCLDVSWRDTEKVRETAERTSR